MRQVQNSKVVLIELVSNWLEFKPAVRSNSFGKGSFPFHADSQSAPGQPLKPPKTNPARVHGLPWENRPWLLPGKETWKHTSLPSWTAAACAEDSHSLTDQPVTREEKQSQSLEGLFPIYIRSSYCHPHRPVWNTDGTSKARLLGRLLILV